MQTELALDVVGLSAGYGQTLVLHDVSLQLAAGESVGLLGLNGAGKSTLLRTIAGLHPAHGGSVSFEGHEVTELPSHRLLGRGLACVPESRELFASLTVEQNLLAALGRVRLRRTERQERIEQATELFPVLRERRWQIAGLLSGGQQQMLAIARALVTRPRVLLLDEPSLGLAPVLVAEIYERLRSMREAGIALLIVEQHVHEAIAMCERMYVLELGRITVSGRSSALAADAGFASNYLGQ